MSEVETCHECDGVALPVRETVEVRVGRRKVAVLADRWRCSECGEVFYTGGQIEDMQRQAATQIRAATHVVSPDEIRELRTGRLGLSQPAFEKLLNAGPKTVVRWERGTVVPNATTNLLLLAIRDVPGLAEYLAEKHGVTLGSQMIASPPEIWAKLYAYVAGKPERTQEQTVRDVVPAAVARRGMTPPIPDDKTIDYSHFSSAPGQTVDLGATDLHAATLITASGGR